MFACVHFGEDLEMDSIFGCVCSHFPSVSPSCTVMYYNSTVIPSPLLEKPRKLTLHWWQQLPWAHSAPSFREQLLALQQGLSHSWKTARCSTVYKADVQDKNGVRALKCKGEKMNYTQCQPFFHNTLVKPSICWFTLLHNYILCWTDWVW